MELLSWTNDFWQGFVTILPSIGPAVTGGALVFAVISYFCTVVREASQAATNVSMFRDNGILTIRSFDKNPVWDLILLSDGQEVELKRRFLEPEETLTVPSIPSDIGNVKLYFRGPKGMRWRCRIDEQPVMADDIPPWKNALYNFVGR